MGAGSSGTKTAKAHWVYIVRCSDGTLYTGYSTDYVRRVKVHNSGRGAKYTRGRLPVDLAYLEEFRTKSGALRREVEIKSMKAREKRRLCSTFRPNRPHSSR